MNCKINCSFGEIIDKVTILNIKKKKAKNQKALFNIKTELKLIENDNLQIKTKDKLFDILYDINMKLWNLEDKIREKSSKKEFDAEYIECAESIHTTNDLRYKIKRKINEKYNSVIKEEKVYDDKFKINAYHDNKNDYEQLESGKNFYQNGEYEKSMKVLKPLMKKYNKYNKNDGFYIDLLFSYSNICSVCNTEFQYYSKIDFIMKNINTIPIVDEQKQFCREIYALISLSQKKYRQSYNYLNELNIAERSKELNGKIVKRHNMGFFKEGDKGKSLLLYSGGGIGDGFMYARFIPIIFQKFPNNKIIFIIDKRTSWIYQKAFENNKLLTIKHYSDEDIPHFDYHCNMMCLIKYLDYEYETLPFTPLFENIKIEPSLLCRKILSKISSQKQGNKCYILNWKGCEKNNHEFKNRRMDLKNAVPLFKMENTNWIIVTKELTRDESILLDNYQNVDYYGNIIDLEQTYIDTICIIRIIDSVISTDTSILHLSANLNVKSYALLTVGCEWRWTCDEEKTKWYPNIKLLRQKKLGDWTNVVQELTHELKTNKV